MPDFPALLTYLGYAGIGAIVFVESGLPIGIFLPGGDSLLFTAGFLASQGVFRIVPLASICFVAAVLGYAVGYAFGRRVGRKLFTREDSLLFHKANLLRAERFYARHGGKVVVLARFLPLIRSFVPILAGVGVMAYPSFFRYNVLGGFLWAVGLTLSGYYLGSVIPDVDRYLLPIVAGIILVSLLPPVLHMLRHAEDRQRLFKILRREANAPNVKRP